MKTKNILTGLALAAGLTGAASAAITAGQVIGIDFNANDANNDTVLGDITATGTNFNSFSEDTDDGETASLASLIDLTGASVIGVTFSLENQTGQNTERANFITQGVEGTASGPLSDIAVWDDGYIANNQGSNPLDANGYFELTFSGLDDGLTYDLTGGYDGTGGNNRNFDAIWTADGQTFTTLTHPTDPANAGYGTLTGLTTDGSGNLVIRVERNTNHVTVGGLTLTAVPEPSTTALLGLGGLALILRRRK